MENITVGQLQIALDLLITRISAYDYTSVSYPAISIKNGDISACLFLQDDFQEDLEWGSKKCQNGTTLFPFRDGAFHIPSGFLSREQRELAIIAQRLGQDKEILAKMQSAAATEFVRRLTEDLEKINLLTAPKF